MYSDVHRYVYICMSKCTSGMYNGINVQVNAQVEAWDCNLLHVDDDCTYLMTITLTGWWWFILDDIDANSMMMHILCWHVQETDVSQTLLIKQSPWWWTVWWWWDELILMMMYTLSYRPWCLIAWQWPACWPAEEGLTRGSWAAVSRWTKWLMSKVDEQLDQQYWCLIWQ